MTKENSNRFGKSLLLGMALPLALGLGGCRSNTYHEVSKDKGTVKFVGSSILGPSGKIELSVCNDATYLGMDGGFPMSRPVIDYIGRKDTFLEGEPIEFVLYSPIGVGRANFRAELIRNGEPIPARRHMTQTNPTWMILPYNGLEHGNYAVVCYGLDEFLGKIDFEVVKPGDAVASPRIELKDK